MRITPRRARCRGSRPRMRRRASVSAGAGCARRSTIAARTIAAAATDQRRPSRDPGRGSCGAGARRARRRRAATARARSASRARTSRSGTRAAPHSRWMRRPSATRDAGAATRPNRAASAELAPQTRYARAPTSGTRAARPSARPASVADAAPRSARPTNASAPPTQRTEQRPPRRARGARAGTNTVRRRRQRERPSDDQVRHSRGAASRSARRPWSTPTPVARSRRAHERDARRADTRSGSDERARRACTRLRVSISGSSRSSVRVTGIGSLGIRGRAHDVGTCSSASSSRELDRARACGRRRRARRSRRAASPRARWLRATTSRRPCRGARRAGGCGTRAMPARTRASPRASTARSHSVSMPIERLDRFAEPMRSSSSSTTMTFEWTERCRRPAARDATGYMSRSRPWQVRLARARCSTCCAARPSSAPRASPSTPCGADDDDLGSVGLAQARGERVADDARVREVLVLDVDRAPRGRDRVEEQRLALAHGRAPVGTPARCARSRRRRR